MKLLTDRSTGEQILFLKPITSGTNFDVTGKEYYFIFDDFIAIDVIRSKSYLFPWTLEYITSYAWHKADDISTLAFNGAKVSQWDDVKGNGINLEQAIEASQPTNADLLNGKKVMTFDKAFAQYMKASAVNFSTSDYSFMGLIKPQVVTHAGQSIASYGASAGEWQLDANAATQFDGALDLNSAGTGANLSYNQTNVTDWALWGFDAEVNTKITTYFNGVSQVENTDFTTFDITDPVDYIFSANKTSARRLGCQIAEVFMIPRQYREEGEGYILWEWGLENLLPVGHKYKNRRP